MADTIKRSQFALFLDTTPAAAETWSLVGDGVTTATVNMNPQTEEETYIHQDSGNTELVSYRPAMPMETTGKKGDAVHDFVDSLRRARAVLAAADTEVVMAYLYETEVTGAFPAEKQAVSVQVDTYGGDGGSSNKLGYTLNFKGDPIPGMFNPTTLAFVAD